MLNKYSAPTIAVIQDLGFLFIVDKNNSPSGLSKSMHVFTNNFGSGTCSKTSRQVTTSNFFLDESSRFSAVVSI